MQIAKRVGARPREDSELEYALGKRRVSRWSPALAAVGMDKFDEARNSHFI